MEHRALSARTSSTLSLRKYYTAASHLSDASSKVSGSGSSSAANRPAHVLPVIGRGSAATRIDDAPTSTKLSEIRRLSISSITSISFITAAPPDAKFLARRELDACAVRPAVTHAGGMLPRATTACLKARAARDSLPCAQQHHARRPSTRLLHHTFWTHGAGDLDLPPCIASSTPPVGLPRWHGDTRTEPKNSRAATPTPTLAGPDGVFLDLLYPPQALAYLQRANRQHLESWEHRKAKRLPDGFVRAYRHYSSTSRAKSRHENSPPDSEPQMEVAEQQEIVDVDTDATPKGGPLAEVAGEHTDTARVSLYQPFAFATELDTGDDADTRTGVSNAIEARAVGSQYAHFANTPGDLAETQADGTRDSLSGEEHASVTPAPVPIPLDIPHEPAQRLRQLRIFMALKPDRVTPPLIRQAWKLYLSLHDDDKQDLPLKEKLLVWLNEQEDELADAYITALFWSFPLVARTLPIYQTVAVSFLRSKASHELLSMLHEEALANIENGQQFSLQLFTHALDARKLNAMHRVVREHNRAFNTMAEQSMRQKLFWVKVGELPGLTSRVAPLLKSFISVNQTFRLKLAQEAVQQAIEHLFEERELPDRSSDIFALLKAINRIDPSASSFFRAQLVRLLPALGQYNVDKFQRPHYVQGREKAHQIISYLYWHSREGEDARLHPDLMLIWLKHLTSRMDMTNKELRSERNVTAGMVIEDWQKWHGQLSADAVHNLISYSAHAGTVDALNQWTAYLNRRFPSYQEQRKAFWAQVYVHAKLSDLSAAKEAFKDVSRSARAHGDRIDLKCWNVLLHAHQQADDLGGAIETFKELLQRTKLVPDFGSFGPLVSMLARRGDVDALEDILQQFDIFTHEKRPTDFVHAQIMALNLVDDAPRAELLLQESIQKVRKGEIIGSMTECVNLMLAKYASMRDIDATMRVYGTMKRQNIFRNAATYRHLMQALANFRQANAAWPILTKRMKQEGFVPTAAHYTVAMAGFINEDAYRKEDPKS
ncbi:hypothetical protein BST61_g958 [Cercospora zeina]